MSTITCGWCNTPHSTWQSKCDSCSGPMPARPRMGLPPAPPPAPRELPEGFEFRTKWSGNIWLLVGLVFTVLGIIALVMRSRGLWVPMFSPALLPLGTAISSSRWRKAADLVRLLRHGIAVEGQITSLTIDSSLSMNLKHAWILVYQFQVDGRLMETTVTTFESTIANRSAGEPLWVLYLPKNPQKNTLYPPMKFLSFSSKSVDYYAG